MTGGVGFDEEEPPPVLGQNRRLSDRYLQDGALVAQTYAGQDRWDPTRPSLGVLVAEALALAERKGEQRANAERERGDARYSDLLDRIAGVVRQRQDLAVEQDRLADRRADEQPHSAAACARWAAELRGQVDAIRSTLDPAEQAEVAGRVERLRAGADEELCSCGLPASDPVHRPNTRSGHALIPRTGDERSVSPAEHYGWPNPNGRFPE